MRNSTRLFALSLILALSVAACNEPVRTNNPGYPYRMEKIAGDSQSALMQTAVATPPAVKLFDYDGNPSSGVAVTFVVNHGGGHLVGASTVLTGSNGVATAGGWVLGNVLGANSMSVSLGDPDVVGNPALFTATATAPAGIKATTAAGGN